MERQRPFLCGFSWGGLVWGWGWGWDGREGVPEVGGGVFVRYEEDGEDGVGGGGDDGVG